MSERKRESGDVACLVIAVGEPAFRVLRSIPRTGYWGLAAVGQGAELAAADRTLAPRDGEDRDAWHARAIRRLEDEWREVGFVYVVHDERNLEDRRLAASITLAGHRPERVAISVLLEEPGASFVGVRGDLRLRPSRGASATESGRADALRTVLGPFEACWMPQALELLADAMRELGEGQVFATRTREAMSAGHALAMLLDDPKAARASVVHMTLGRGVHVGFGELTAALERHEDQHLAITSSIDDAFPNGEVLIGAITPAARGRDA